MLQLDSEVHLQDNDFKYKHITHMLKILQDSGLKENKFTNKVLKITISSVNVGNILIKLN